MIQGFKEFITRGNVIDLAVGLIVGAAFTAVVTGLMDGVLNPLIALIFGEPDVSKVGFHIFETAFPVGLLLQAVLNFFIVSTALYFVVVLPLNRLMSLRKKGEVAEPKAPAEDVILLQEIRDLLRAQSNRSDEANLSN